MAVTTEDGCCFVVWVLVFGSEPSPASPACCFLVFCQEMDDDGPVAEGGGALARKAMMIGRGCMSSCERLTWDPRSLNIPGEETRICV